MDPMQNEYTKNAPKIVIWGGKARPNRMSGNAQKDQSRAKLWHFVCAENGLL